MAGSITLERSEGDGVAFLTLSNPAKLNAIDIAMWRELHALMLHLQALPPEDAPHAVILRGAGGQFASGGDIVEFANFRFEEHSLRDFHENVVAPALHLAEALAALSPQAARINKRTLRQFSVGGPSDAEREAHYAYADSHEHREVVTAFIEKRTPRFQRG